MILLELPTHHLLQDLHYEVSRRLVPPFGGPGSASGRPPGSGCPSEKSADGKEASPYQI